MNTREIKQLRRKFIMISMFSFLLVMLFIGAAINTISYAVTTISIHTKLQSIALSNGLTEETTEIKEDRHPYSPSFLDAYNPSYRHNHFFISYLDANSDIVKFFSNTDSSSETDSVKYYSQHLFQLSREFGRYGTYYYLKSITADGLTEIAIIDCTSELSTIMRLFSATVITCTLALLITFLLVLLLSEKMIQPEIENSMRQKQFITNASHELKTPLAVIRANTELLEMMHGEDEWTKSILKQVDHLNGLIQNLVLIAKAAEREDKTTLSTVDASLCVDESVANFEALAKQSGKELNKLIEKEVKIIADESKIRQLTTLLVDNAIKYCDEGGKVSVSLTALKKGKNGLRLTVSNSYADGAGLDCNRFFDRFYRQDQSHNIDQGGYGIGLSIADSICQQNGGSIKASWKDGIITFHCILP